MQVYVETQCRFDGLLPRRCNGLSLLSNHGFGRPEIDGSSATTRINQMREDDKNTLRNAIDNLSMIGNHDQTTNVPGQAFTFLSAHTSRKRTGSRTRDNGQPWFRNKK